MAKTCYICKLSDVNDLELGEFLECNNVHVHYFCLLLTTNLEQNGEDNEGLLGFLMNDIRKCVQGLKKNICYVCYKPYANIECSKCTRKFHTPCGLNHCLNTFKGKFISYCESHHQIPINEIHKKTESCLICYDAMNNFNPITSIKPICCKSGWMHKNCVAHYAKTAGYFCKCPLCNNETTFREFIVKRGIFLPDQDAAWELEPNAYSELLERPRVCQAANCIATSRDIRNIRNRMKTCSDCGSYIAHIKCWNAKTQLPFQDFTCDNCTLISNRNNTDPSTNNLHSSVEEPETVVSSDGDDDDCRVNNQNFRRSRRTKRRNILMATDSDGCSPKVRELRSRNIVLNTSNDLARQSKIRQSLDSSSISSTSECSSNQRPSKSRRRDLSNDENQHFRCNSNQTDDGNKIDVNISDDDETIMIDDNKQNNNSGNRSTRYLKRLRRQIVSLDSDSDDMYKVKELRGRTIKINASNDFDRQSESIESLDVSHNCSSMLESSSNQSSSNVFDRGDHKKIIKTEAKKRKPDANSSKPDFGDVGYSHVKRLRRSNRIYSIDSSVGQTDVVDQSKYSTTKSHEIHNISNESLDSINSSSEIFEEGSSHKINKDDRKRLVKKKRQITFDVPQFKNV